MFSPPPFIITLALLTLTTLATSSAPSTPRLLTRGIFDRIIPNRRPNPLLACTVYTVRIPNPAAETQWEWRRRYTLRFRDLSLCRPRTTTALQWAVGELAKEARDTGAATRPPRFYPPTIDVTEGQERYCEVRVSAPDTAWYLGRAVGCALGDEMLLRECVSGFLGGDGGGG